MTKGKVKEVDQEAMMDQLSGAQRVDINAILKSEVEFLNNMRTRFGKDKIVDETEKRVKDLFRVFAKAANQAFPDHKYISVDGLGILTEPLNYYDWVLIVSTKGEVYKTK